MQYYHVLAPRIDQRVCLMRTRGIRLKELGQRVEVSVAAGESWHGLVRWSLGMGLCGLENLILIPGSAGAAPVQNIGAYGVEVARFIESVDVLDANGATRTDFGGMRRAAQQQ